MSIRNRTALAAAICAIVSACGGGSDKKDFTTTPAEIASHFSIDPASVTVSHATVTTPMTQFTNCNRTSGSYDVLETPNTIVYNADTVSATDLDNAARYTEAAIVTHRTTFGLSGTVGLDGTNKIRVCVTNLHVGGEARVNDFLVEINTYPDKNAILASLIKHELMHAVERIALGCSTYYAFEAWMMEGMALHEGWQDLPKKSDLSSLQALFTNGAVPMDDTYALVRLNLAKYPAYRLAYDTMLGELGKTDVDIYNFLKAYHSQHGCPSGDSTSNWKTEFDAYFPGANLRGTGALGSGFWSAAVKYAQ